jgi:hypothetical protein
MNRRRSVSECAGEVGENDESLGNREPQGKNRSPGAAQKIYRLAGMLQRQFREVMKALTRRSDHPAPGNKTKRKGEEERGFRLASFKTVLKTRTVRSPHPRETHMWDAFAWLQIWHAHTPDDGSGFSGPGPTVEKQHNSIPNL